MSAPLRIAVVFPDLLGTYGDGGNGLILTRRAQWRGRDAELLQAPSDRPLPEADIYCLGGGEDGPQVRAAQALTEDGTLTRRASEGAVVLAVCAGFQVVGRAGTCRRCARRQRPPCRRRRRRRCRCRRSPGPTAPHRRRAWSVPHGSRSRSGSEVRARRDRRPALRRPRPLHGYQFPWLSLCRAGPPLRAARRPLRGIDGPPPGSRRTRPAPPRPPRHGPRASRRRPACAPHAPGARPPRHRGSRCRPRAPARPTPPERAPPPHPAIRRAGPG